MQRCNAPGSFSPISRRLALMVSGAAMFILHLWICLPACATETLRIGSKRFTESYILGEIIAGTARRAGTAHVEHRPGLGNSAILFSALKNGAIDLYPDYTGTVALELLGLTRVPPLEELNRLLAKHGLAAGVVLGFDNAYALAMPEQKAEQLRSWGIGDLRSVQGLRAGLSPEFLSRRDGWPALRAAYALDGLQVRSLEHGLAYDALVRDQIDVIDVYATDPQIELRKLRLLRDDLRVFPEYAALLVYRIDLPQRHPRAWAALARLQGSISVEAIRRMNAAVELEGNSFSAVAGQWLEQLPDARPASRQTLWSRMTGPDLLRLTAQHLLLVCSALILSVLIGIPLGIWAQRSARAGRWIIPGMALLQTVPSLAMLAFLIALLDQIGALPAILALFLYALLPVVRGTETAMAAVGKSMVDAGRALGLDGWQCLRLIELPLASQGILAGVKTAAVISVGTATIAAFIGAGGFGERIVAGLAVNDRDLMLAGAIPAAFLAVTLEGLFRILDRRLWGWKSSATAR